MRDDEEHLPSLESDDPAWVAARRREDAAGKRPAGQETAERLSSAVLGRIERHRAVLDLTCRSRHVARVLALSESVAVLPGVVLQVACEARPTAGGIGAGFWLLDGRLDEPVVIAACRCKAQHVLPVNRLISAARDATPGRPNRMPVRHVEATLDT